MSVSESSAIQVLTPAAALPAGIGLFFLVRLLEGALAGSMAANAVIEEGVKVLLFALLPAARLIFKAPGRRREIRDGLLLQLPLLCVAAFGITENILYFLTFPTSSVYQRLLYTYPIHLHTALLYALAFLSRRMINYVLCLLFSVLYHLGLNALSLRLPAAGIYAIGIINALTVLLLYRRLHTRLAERSIRECWKNG